jgi:hypothetical protein
MGKDGVPIVFVSYAHYDGDTNYRHKVAALSQRLRENGIDARIDQYEENDPPASWPRWMIDRLEEAEFVLVVCSHTYRRRFEGKEEDGKGQGSTWEGGHITAKIYAEGGSKHKFIPVTFGSRESLLMAVPPPLDTTTSYDVTSEAGFDRLLRRIHKTPSIVAPEVGTKPDLDVEPAKPQSPSLADIHVEIRSLISHERRIDLDQRIRTLTKSAAECLSARGYGRGAPQPTTEAIQGRVDGMEECMSQLVAAMSEIAYYGHGDELEHLSRQFGVFATREAQPGFIYDVWEHLWYYPLTFLLYTCGTAAMAKKNYNALYELLHRASIIWGVNGKRQPVARIASTPYTLARVGQHLDQPVANAKFPASEYLVTRVPHVLTGLLESPDAELAFDQFEHFLSLALFDAANGGLFVGRFVYKLQRRYSDIQDNEITEPVAIGLLEGPDWKALQAGFFGSNPDQAKTSFEQHIAAIQERGHW